MNAKRGRRWILSGVNRSGSNRSGSGHSVASLCVAYRSQARLETHSQHLVDDLLRVRQRVEIGRGRDSLAERSIDLGAYFRAHVAMPIEQVMDPRQRRRRRFVPGEEHAQQLIAQRAVVELVALRAAAVDEPGLCVPQARAEACPLAPRARALPEGSLSRPA